MLCVLRLEDYLIAVFKILIRMIHFFSSTLKNELEKEQQRKTNSRYILKNSSRQLFRFGFRHQSWKGQ